MLSIQKIPDTFRITASPMAIWVAWLRLENWYLLILLVYLFATSISAIKLFRNPAMAHTPIGRSANVATFLSVAAGGWLLFPHLIIQERILVLVLSILCITSAITAIRATGTKASRANSALILLPMIILMSVTFGYYTNNTWPFRLAVLIQLFVVIEWFSFTRKTS